jgi:hypothetical protein
MFSFSRNGILDVTKPFELFDYLKNESDILLWRMIVSHLKEMTNMLQSTDTYREFKTFLLHVLKSVYLNFKADENKQHEKFVNF